MTRQKKPREWLTQLRVDMGMTQAQLGKFANVTNYQISKIEIGKNNPSVLVAKKIADVLNFNWTQFYE